MNLNIRIAGEAGQGVQTTGSLLAGVFASLGLHLLVSQSYMSRIRGGLNWVDLRLSDAELFAPCETGRLARRTDTGGRARRSYPRWQRMGCCFSTATERRGGIPFSRTAREVAKSAVMANAVAAGAVFTVLGYPLDILIAFLEQQFQQKGDAGGGGKRGVRAAWRAVGGKPGWPVGGTVAGGGTARAGGRRRSDWPGGGDGRGQAGGRLPDVAGEPPPSRIWRRWPTTSALWSSRRKTRSPRSIWHAGQPTLVRRHLSPPVVAASR